VELHKFLEPNRHLTLKIDSIAHDSLSGQINHEHQDPTVVGLLYVSVLSCVIECLMTRQQFKEGVLPNAYKPDL